jgi:malonyl-CoA/methylmalonyl-CoA synthetase
MSDSLHSWSLKRGEHVALYLENSPSFVVTYLGVTWLGGVIVPVNTCYRETKIRHMLHDSGARLVVTDASGQAEVQKVVQDIASVNIVMEVGADPGHDVASWRAVAEAQPPNAPVRLTPTDLEVTDYTSGTTGRSKGTMLMLSHSNFCSNSAAFTEASGWTLGDHHLLVLPLFHMHGLGVGLHSTPLQNSITLKREFDAAETLDELHSGRISMFSGVPIMYLRLLDEAHHRSKRPQGLRLLVSCSALLSPQNPPDVEEAMDLQILEWYGVTKTVMNLGNLFRGERMVGAVGLPFARVEVRVVEPTTGAPLTEGEIGEVHLRNPNITAGYWQNSHATEEMKPRDIHFVPSLSRNAFGKVQKHLLEAQLIDRSAWTGKGKEVLDVHA